MSRLPPAEKLPLAARKNLRDKWEDKKADLEKQLSDALGTPWTIDININQIYPYAKDGTYAKESPGGLLHDYVNGAHSCLGTFFYYFGEGGKQEINTLCSAHVLTMDVDLNSKVEGNGCEVSPSGQLVLLFNPDYLNSNIENCLERNKLEKALNEAQSSLPMNFKARSSIANEYEKGIGKIQSIINEQLGKKITIDPGFEDAFVKLKAGASRRDFDENLGPWILLYFQGFAEWLERNNVKGDDMVQEGLNDVMGEAKVAFRVVEKMKGDSYNEAIPEGGVLYLQTDAKNYGSNVENAAERLMDLL
ncbi:hypothetical protein VFPPC_06097 [Pochonia chlamydosporia 170]|uniref:Uncharacterized protein n=1 Tax=Pochonia chlamydosporia 170 TaxID=1380566 RepID=A0A179FHL6_METCM|nr:hypothetical protein VFPPC_06097 [Pochonia chlamydosporia 170]OAQ64907.1 hypothetical protein VFPPC_06097 [Pochonia chlamydosporia 170]